MENYEKFKLKQLRELLNQRGLPWRRLNKGAMIEALMQDDAICADPGNVASDVEVDDDVDIGANAEADGKGISGESEQITALRLQLEIAKLQLQHAQLGQPSGAMTVPQYRESRPDLSGIKSRLPVMSQNSDVISFFSAYEKTLQINSVPTELWAKLLPTVLNDRAMKVFAQMTVEQCNDYSCVRSTIIDAFKANAETYLHRMQTAKRAGAESYRLFVGRLREYQSHYFHCKEIDSFDKLKEDMLLNMFLDSLPSHVCEFVKAKTPKSVNDAAVAADLCFSIKGSNMPNKKPDNKKPGGLAYRQTNPIETSKQDSCSDYTVSGDSRQVNAQAINSKASASQSGSQVKPQTACWNCGSNEHKRVNCPNAQKRPQRPITSNPSAFVDNSSRAMAKNRFIVPIFIGNNNTPYVSYRDTGSHITLINSNLVDKSEYTGQTVVIQGVLDQSRQFQ
jgi:hypothetical protein